MWTRYKDLCACCNLTLTSYALKVLFSKSQLSTRWGPAAGAPLRAHHGVPGLCRYMDCTLDEHHGHWLLEDRRYIL